MSAPTTLPLALPIAPIAGPAPAARDQEATRVRELAREFESMLLLQMVRQMRQSLILGEDEEGGGLGLGRETLTDTIDVELARELSAAGGIGVADLIVSAFERQSAGRSTKPEPAQAVSLPPNAALHAAPAIGVAPLVSAAASPVGAAHATPVSADPTASVGRATPRAAAEPALPLPTDAPVTSRFGWRADPFDGRRRFHGGIDVGAAYGTPVETAAPGRVVFAGEQGGYGTTVVIEHRPGLQTRYAHLSASDVRTGELVEARQAIGRVGRSGRATGTHLHFELIQDGRRVDPQVAADRFAALAAFKPQGLTADSPNDGEPPALVTEE